MKLSDLLSYDSVAIQCHDNPDADTLAAGLGLYYYFQSNFQSNPVSIRKKGKKTPKFFYGGPAPITKPNLTGMVETLEIPVEYLPDLKEWDGLLVTVDCQHGATNVMKVNAPHVAVIDHHIQESSLPQLCDLRPSLGSCSTLVWVLLTQESFAIDSRLATALYYGLFCDTDNFAEVCHPLDYDMRDMLYPDESILRKLKHSNLSLNDLHIVSTVLKENFYDPQGRFMIISTPPCDPNLLGFVSDLAMQVDVVDVVVAFSAVDDRIKFSVRTAIREVKASDLTIGLAHDVGWGGGHREKAGGLISGVKYAARFGECPLTEFFTRRLREYLGRYQVIDCMNLSPAVNQKLDIDAMKNYRKLPVKLGFVPCRELFEKRTKLQIRMLEGDVDITTNEDMILMIGIKGEVYPMQREKFEESYAVVDEPFSLPISYPPTILDHNAGTRISLPEYAKVCVGGGGHVSAMRLKSGVKVFTRWDAENYLLGNVNDWIVKLSPDDLYVVTADVFDGLYIRDFTGEDISSDPRCVRAVKKDIPVPVTFASENGVMETREGTVSYRKGDALLKGSGDEAWPVALQHFMEVYVPADDIAPGENGKYSKKAFPVFALQVEEPFMVDLSDERGRLQGGAKDWLLQYVPNNHGIVSQEIFKMTYEIL
ncbi:MAG: DHH family phosphoesterase [Synergistaceae bacterium]|jgi:phosphoglycolate phosphatase|nr:DHH family phosphoesterase [Synergistaceae bacterium]